MQRLFENGWDEETNAVNAEIIKTMKDKAKELCEIYNVFDVENIFHQAVTDLMLEIRLDRQHSELNGRLKCQ